MENPNLDNIVLALLFASDEALTARKIAALVEDVTAADVKRAIDAWNARADAEAWSIAIEQVAGGYRLATRPEYASYVSRLYAGRRKFRLSRAGLETLAIIAYKQPITRAEIESLRGVGSGTVVANLMERSLVQIVGKAKVLGAPFLYGTTQEFLEYLGLNSLKDLPSAEDLEALLAQEAAGEAAIEGEEGASSDVPRDEDGMPLAGEGLAGLIEALDPAEADDEADALGAGAARVGPRVAEPVNRPLSESPQDVADDAAPADEQEALSGDNDVRHD